MGGTVATPQPRCTPRKEHITMVRQIVAPLIVVAAASVLAAACQPMPPALSLRPPSAQGYPQPGTSTPPPGATATPTADADGFLPPPDEPSGQLVRLADSPYADVLVGLQEAIDGGDSAWFGARAPDGRRVHVFGIGQMDSEGGTSANGEAIGALADAFFQAGARPRIQAYFESVGETTVCLYVLTHAWQGAVPYPGVDDIGSAEPVGGQPPATVPLDGAALHICRDQLGEWLLRDWIHGGYHETIERFGAFAPPWPLYVVRP